MTRQQRLDELALLWEERYQAGEDVPAEELERLDPDLADALRERIGDLKAVARFIPHQAPPADATISLRPLARRAPVADRSPSQPADGQCLADLLPPRYLPRDVVGSGGMGLVLGVHDITLDRVLALKVLPGHDRSGGAQWRFWTEARVTSQLQHPGVPPVHDIGHLRDGRPFFTMKLVQGHTLAELLRERKEPRDGLEGWLRVFELVCQTVGYAHSRGVIHRDLKPSNIMVGEFGEVQVMDWGLAKVLGERGGSSLPADSDRRNHPGGSPEQTQAGAVVGTFAYMPPEQARGEVTKVDERSDVFGLGAILCEILTGLPPYGSSTAEVSTLAQHAALGPALGRLAGCGADADLVSLARACLHPEREARPRNGAEVAQAVLRYRQNVHLRLLRSEQERGAAAARAEEEEKRASLFLGAVSLLTRAIEGQTESARGHTYRVSTYAVLLASRLGLPAREVELVRVGALLRDIGKIGIDDAVLRKHPDRLSAEETQLLKAHPARGAKILATVPELCEVVPIVRSHHERWDGRGYPDGLAGEAIPVLARVVALADAFDAWTSELPDDNGVTAEGPFVEIKRQAGKMFDPGVASAFLSIREAIVQGMLAFKAALKAATGATRIMKVSPVVPSDSVTNSSSPSIRLTSPKGRMGSRPVGSNCRGKYIRLRRLTGPLKGRTWEASDVLRVGRVEECEVVLDDSSVSRCHAEVKATERGWRVRDLGSTNGTRLNGARLGSEPRPLRARDLLQFGEVAIQVETLSDGEPEAEPDQSNVPECLRVDAISQLSWDEAIEGLVFDDKGWPRPGEQLVALLRAGYYLARLDEEDEFLESVLDDAVSVLDAQRGAIVLREEGRLILKKSRVGRGQPSTPLDTLTESIRRPYSQSLANRCINQGESILCQRVDEDAELALARSIEEGGMASVICVLLRTPHRKLGVLHLDRNSWQDRFTREDLRLADALAAHVSIGIETLRKMKQLAQQGQQASSLVVPS
jgi:putative nucleotidyltransferase with HDIG domain